MCRRQVADLAKYVGVFEQENAQLVIIGNGEAHFIKPFREATGYKGKILTDPSLKTYDALNFKRSMGSLIGFKSLKEGIRSMGTGYLPKGIQGDSLQQGGAIIISPDDAVRYFYGSREAGDYPPVQEMLEVVSALKTELV